MISNHKLTGVLHGRSILAINSEDASLAIKFDDGSIMTVQKSADCPAPTLACGEVDKARQDGTQLALDLADGSTIAIAMADETSCVMVRDQNHVLEYAD